MIRTQDRQALVSTRMQAARRDRYGKPHDVIELREVERPQLADDGVLVRVRAASLNRADWYALAGVPYVGRVSTGLRRPKQQELGIDFAGVVEAVGKDVTGLRPGDEVFGARNGSLAEYVSARKFVLRKPANATFEQAAALPVAGLTALQGLRDKGGLRRGESVLVNGASGGVGTMAVQVAKALGAEVTAVCRTRNVELVRDLGADHVVDYAREDFSRSGRRYDLVLDVAGGRRWGDIARALAPEGRLVVVGAPMGSGLLGPLTGIARLRLGAALHRRRPSSSSPSW